VASWKKPLGAALLVEAIGLAGFFAAAAARFSANEVVPSLAFAWERAEALLGFIRWLPALQFLGLALALGSSGEGDSEAEGEALAAKAVVPAVLLSAAFSAFALLAGPALEASRSSILAASATFNASLGAARASREAGELDKAKAELAVCAAIAPKDGRLAEETGLFETALLKARQAEKAPPPAPEPAAPGADRKTASEYYRKALAYSAKGDQFSAHWYAQQASRLDPSLTEAKRLAATSWEALASRGGEDPEAAEFYARKLEGYGLLRSGDPVGAYIVFKALAARNPEDADVRRYLAESLAEAEKAAFFRDEYERALAGGELRRVFLSLPAAGAKPGRSASAAAAPEAGKARILAAASASFAEGAAYFRELEYLEAGPGGASLALVRAPYAKLAEGRLLLLCVEREGSSRVYRPSWSGLPAQGPSSYLPIDLKPELAYRVLAARSRPASLDLVSAWRALPEAAAYGADTRPAARDFAERTGTPFALFAAGLLGALAGARFRRRSGGPGKSFPRRLYALVPLMAAAGLPAYLAARRVDALLSAWAAAALPDRRAAWLAGLVRAALLVAALLVVAGARADRGPAPDEER